MSWFMALSRKNAPCSFNSFFVITRVFNIYEDFIERPLCYANFVDRVSTPKVISLKIVFIWRSLEAFLVKCGSVIRVWAPSLAWMEGSTSSSSFLEVLYVLGLLNVILKFNIGINPYKDSHCRICGNLILLLKYCFWLPWLLDSLSASSFSCLDVRALPLELFSSIYHLGEQRIKF